MVKNDRSDYLAENPMGSYHQSGTCQFSFYPQLYYRKLYDKRQINNYDFP